MTRVLLFLALAAAAFVPLHAGAAESLAWPSYTVVLRGGGLGYEWDEVTVISHAVVAGPQRQTVWIAERRRNDRGLQGPTVDHQWIDGRKCPALRTALEAISRLPPVRFGGPDDMVEIGPAFDGPLTTLRGPPADRSGAVDLSRSESNGPVARWQVEMSRAVAGCWQAAPVAIPGVSIIERLGDASAAANRGR